MTANILQDVINYVNTQTTPYAPIKIDTFAGTSGENPVNELMFRTDPGTYKQVVYLDKSRVGVFAFAAYAKHSDPQIAQAQLDTILAILDLPDYIQITDVCKIKVEPVTSPSFFQKSDRNEYIYTASLGLEYFKEA